jgi:hypothetical protein
MLITNDSGMSLIQRDFFQDEMTGNASCKWSRSTREGQDYQVK